MIRRNIQPGSYVGMMLAISAIAISVSERSAFAQVPATDLVVRIDQLERQIRQLTGAIEQLQFRNQQLEQQVRRMQDDAETRAPDAARGGARPMPPRSGAIAQPPPAAAATPAPPPAMPAPGTRRPDVFDPALNPDAPGAPRQLGVPGRRSEVVDPRYEATPGPGASPALPRGGEPGSTAIVAEEPPVGIPGGRQAGAPLDLSTLASAAVADPALAPRPDAALRQPAPAANTVAALPPTQSPRDQFDLAYGYLLHKDYALAEQGLRAFIEKHPGDPLTADAHYWLAESMFQRQDYREAAEAFVLMSKKYERHAKAPDALVRLGQSLAALKERELACATYGEVTRKYPRASASVKQLVEREQKRARC